MGNMDKRHQLPRAFVFALLCGFVSNAPVVGEKVESWPSFRGDPQLTGVAHSTLPEELTPLWIVEREDGFESTAALSDKTAFVGSLDGTLMAVDLATGEDRWQYKAGEEIRSSPLLHHGVVLVGDENGTLHAVDSSSGRGTWTFSAAAAITSSPTPTPGCIAFGSHDSFLYCVAPDDGSLVWKLETEGFVQSTPALYGDLLVAAGCDGYLRLVQARDGKQLKAAELGGYVGASAAVVSGRAFIGTFSNEVLAVDLESAETAWRYRHPTREFPFYSSAAVAKGIVVVGGRDRMVHGIDASTGGSRWTFDAGSRVDTSPVITGDRVVVATGEGELMTLDLDTGKPIWRYDIASPIAASPAVASGRLVIGTLEGSLYCFGASSNPGASPAPRRRSP
jgi:outer membrane protein assembly factor BamB